MPRVKGGVVHGKTDEIGFHAVEDRHYVTDVHATILRLMGRSDKCNPRTVTVPIKACQGNPDPDSEPKGDYLRAVGKQLTQLAGKYGSDRVAVDIVQISTQARKH